MAALLALCGRRRPVPLLPVLLLCAVSSIRTTDAALVPRTSATLPDLRTPHALLGVIALCISVPIYVVSIVLLWRRRGFFPIAGRGFVYLITLAVVVLIAQIEMIGVLVAYPQGIPCGIQMMHALIFDYAVIFTYMFRGWILVFRLEIMNYLTETRWRSEKHQLLTQHAQRQQDARAEEQEAQETATGQPVAIRIGNESGADGGDGAVPVDTSPIGGEFFLLHRSYIEPRVLLRTALSVYLLVVASVIMTMVFDPDVSLNNSYYHGTGQLAADEWLGNDFTVSGFVTAPPCLPYSIKAISNQFIIAVVLLPFLCWVAWRLRINTQRTATRKKEKRAVQMLLRGVNTSADGQHEADRDFDSVASKSSSTSSSSSDSSSSGGGGLFSSSSVDSDLDDTGNVKRELSMALIVMGASVAGFTLVGVLSISNQNWVMIVTFHLLHTISVLLPLRLSFAISRKYRLMMGQSDRAGSGSGGSSGRDGRSQLSHHRPYFTLQFILNHPTTYPVLLTFLQKEYSSENALFWHEAKRFSLACRQLQRRIASWPAGPHEEGGEDVRSGGGGALSQHTLSHQRPAPHVASEQQLSTLHPKQLDVHASSNGAGKDLPFLSPVAVTSTLLGRSSASEDLLFSPTSLPTSPLLRFGGAHTDSAGGGGGGGAGGTGHTPARSHSPSIPLPITTRSVSPSPGGSALVSGPGQAAAALPGPGANLHPGPSPSASPSISAVEMLQLQQPLRAAAKPSPGPQPPLAPVGPGAPALDSLGSPALESVQAPDLTLSPLVIPEHEASGAQYAELHVEAARIKAWCLKMHSDYLAKSAPFEINIPDDLSSLVHSQMALIEHWQPTPASGDVSQPPAPPPFPLSTLYMQTSVAIFNLIATDSFRRFLLTREFRQLLAKADEAQIAQAEKQAALQDTAQLEMDVRRIAGQVAAGSAGLLQGQAHAAHSSPSGHGGGGVQSTSHHSAAFATGTHNRRAVRSINPQSQQLQPPQQRQHHSPLMSAHRLIHSPPSPLQAGAPPSPLAGAAPPLHLPPSLPGSVQEDLPHRHLNISQADN